MTPKNTTALTIFIPNEERRRIQATYNHYERTRRETAASSLSSKILRFMNEDVKLLRYLLKRPTFCTYYSAVFWGQTHDNGESTSLCHSPQYRGIARSHDCVPVMHRVMLIRVGKTHFLLLYFSAEMKSFICMCPSTTVCNEFSRYVGMSIC